GTADGDAQQYTGSAPEYLSYGDNRYIAFGLLATVGNPAVDINKPRLSLASLPQPTVTPQVMDYSYYLADPNHQCVPMNRSTYAWCAEAVSDGSDPPAPRRLDTFNIAFADGHAKAGKMNDWVSENRGTVCSDPVFQKWNPY